LLSLLYLIPLGLGYIGLIITPDADWTHILTSGANPGAKKIRRTPDLPPASQRGGGNPYIERQRPRQRHEYR
jgi:hypothetical protein